MSPPRYLDLFASGELSRRRQALYDRLRRCDLCPRGCGVDRTRRSNGFCRSGDGARVAQAKPHFGEEPCLSGTRGSGTVFFSNCTGRCTFCQNFEISQYGEGEDWPPERLAEAFLDLQEQGCHNLNLVTPTHYAAPILRALELAVPRGFRLPVVYNTNGYDRVSTLRLLDGIVDIYLPDFKYGDDETGLRYSAFGVRDVKGGVKAGYFAEARRALAEMNRQVGALRLDDDGVAVQGVLVRHLVMPGDLARSRTVLQEIAAVSPFLPVSLMAQYWPANRARRFPELARRIERREYHDAVRWLEEAGLDASRGYVQEFSEGYGGEQDHCVPDWSDPSWAGPGQTSNSGRPHTLERGDTQRAP